MFYCHIIKCQWYFFCIKLLAREILFCLFVNKLILFCLFVDAGRKEGLPGFVCKCPLCSAFEQTVRLNVDILRWLSLNNFL